MYRESSENTNRAPPAIFSYGIVADSCTGGSPFPITFQGLSERDVRLCPGFVIVVFLPVS